MILVHSLQCFEKLSHQPKGKCKINSEEYNISNQEKNTKKLNITRWRERGLTIGANRMNKKCIWSWKYIRYKKIPCSWLGNQINVTLPINVWRIVHTSCFQHHQRPVENRCCSIGRPKTCTTKLIHKVTTHSSQRWCTVLNFPTGKTWIPLVVCEAVKYYFADVSVQGF